MAHTLTAPAGATAGTHSVDRPAVRRLALHGGALLAAVAAVALTPDAAAVASPADAELVRLLRLMLVLKAAMAALALGALDWRFRRPVTSSFAAGYVALASLGSASLGALWHLAALGTGAIVLHAAAIALVALACLDRDFVPRIPR